MAVVGGGPSGLSAAAQLNKAGHYVTVFERADRPGGLLMYGIPNMKLDKNAVLKRRIDLLANEGIEFLTNTEVGRNYPAEKLLKDFDAVILCVGATQPRDLQIDGRNLNGVHFAVDYLSANTKAILEGKGEGGYITAKDKDVIVIGGGDTGTDCVGTAIRQGCRNVVQIEILPEPPRERQPNNPWPEWPKVLRVDYGQEEAEALYGRDPRIYLTTVKRLIGNSSGNIEAVETVKVKWEKDSAGRFVPKQIKGSETQRPAQLVLIAMGFLGPEATLLEKLGIDRDPRSNIRAEYGKFKTNLKGVFAAGDCRRGQSLVVWAFNEGRAVARECDRYLMGNTLLP